MKKLMTAVAVAIAAIATNAATYNWTASADWVSADDENALEVMAYVFDANAYSLATVTTALGNGTISILDSALDSAVISDEGWFEFTGAGLSDNADPSALSASMYAILLDTSSAASATRYYASDVMSVDITDAVIADQAAFLFGNIITGDPASWTGSIGGGPLPPEPTPEPTSGLLLLLGMAGLALKRKVA